MNKSISLFLLFITSIFIFQGCGKTEKINTNLSSLSVSGFSLTPEFSPNIYNYSVKVFSSTDKIDIKAISESKDSIAAGTGIYNLPFGTSVYTVVSTSKGKSSEYRLNITRPLSSDCRIKSIKYNDFSLTPYLEENDNYTVILPADYNVSILPSLTVEPQDIFSTVAITSPTAIPGKFIIAIQSQDKNWTTIKEIMFTKVSPPPELPDITVSFEPFLYELSPTLTGASIYYTLDGTEPAETSSLYSSPFLINNSSVIKAKQYCPGYLPSETLTKSLTITGALPDPIISPIEGVFTSPVEITITPSADNCETRYTIDGSEPNELSPLYSIPFIINSSATLKVKSFKHSWLPSKTLTKKYTITGRLPPPRITPESGFYTTAVSITITSNENESSDIRYTLDGSIPDSSSPLYNSPFTITTSCVIKAFSEKSNWISSEISSAEYTITGKADIPLFSKATGKYDAPIELILSSTTSDSVIHYTTDGSEPDSSSALYSSPIIITQSAVICAKSFIPNWLPSDTVRESYTINSSTIVLPPVFEAKSGFYLSLRSFAVSLPVASTGDIRYSIDGTEPTTLSALYTSPINLSDTGIYNIKAKLYSDNAVSSSASAEYYIRSSLASPVPSISPGTFYSQFYLGFSAEPYCKIRYTLDGSEPNSSSPILSSTISINKKTTVKAAAFSTDNIRGSVFTGQYNITGICSIPTTNLNSTLYYNSQWVELYTATPDAEIRYTLDGSNPTPSSLLYTAPFTITSSVVIKACVFKSGWKASDILEKSITITGKLSNVTAAKGSGLYPTPFYIFLSSNDSQEIRYTLDGSEPSKSSLLYKEGIYINKDTFLKVRSYRDNWFPSDIAVYEYRFKMAEVEPGTNMFASVGYPFFISKTETTFEEYDNYCNQNNIILPGDEGFGREKRPVINISYYDAVRFCNWLSTQEGLPNSYNSAGELIDSLGNLTDNPALAKGYRLPTESEWKYAAAGGKYSSAYLYSGGSLLNTVAWCYSNADLTTHPVALLSPNEIGIFDMSGNVYEMTSTNFDSEKVICGGSFDLPEDELYFLDIVSTLNPASSAYSVGFRIILTK